MTVRLAELAFCFVPWLAACTRAERPADEAPQAGESSVASAPQSAASPSFRFGAEPYVAPTPRPTGLNKNECPLRPALEHFLLTADQPVDCGDLPKYATSSMRQAAQRCVLQAYAAGRAFRVTYESYSYDSQESTGLAARDGSAVTCFRRSSTAVAAWTLRARLWSWTYSDMAAREDCTFENGDLCLDLAGGRSVAEGCEKLETF